MNATSKIAIPAVVLAVLVGTTGCTDRADFAMGPDAVPRVDGHLTSDVSAHLGADGLFMEEALRPSSLREISPERARELAQAFIRTHGQGLRPAFEKDHGGLITIEALRTCGRTYYAETPYYGIPAEVPPHYHRRLGSWWLVTLCGEGGRRQVSVAVSALSHDLGISVDGRLAYPPSTGANYMAALGIPASLGELPPEPERAVAKVGGLTGQQIVALPRLVAPGLLAPFIGQYPQMARWRIALASPTDVAVRGQRSPRETAIVYHGVGLFMQPPLSFVAASEQPAYSEFVWYTPTGVPQQQHGRAVRKEHIPTVFDTIATGGR